MKEYLPLLMLPLAFLGIAKIGEKGNMNVETEGIPKKTEKDVLDAAREDMSKNEFHEWADAYYISREDLFEIIKKIIKK